MNKLIFTAILSRFAGLYAMAQNEIQLMDMDLNKSYQTYGGAVKGKSFSVYEMPFDSDDRERKGLFKRRLHYTVAPWATENPIFMHLTSSDPDVIRTAIDQCATVGYEMVIISFGSGLNAEDISEENIAKYKSLVDYARNKGVESGCYSLLSSRWISDEVDVINPKIGKRGGDAFR